MTVYVLYIWVVVLTAGTSNISPHTVYGWKSMGEFTSQGNCYTAMQALGHTQKTARCLVK